MATSVVAVILLLTGESDGRFIDAFVPGGGRLKSRGTRLTSRTAVR